MHYQYFKHINLLLRITVLFCSLYRWLDIVEASNNGCNFRNVDGSTTESEGVRFVRLREDAEIGKEIITLNAYPRSTVALKSAGDGNDDYKYFGLTELNSSTIAVTLKSSLEDLVDRDLPRNLLKFKISCAGRKENSNEEGNFLSATVYVEDVNDNAPEFVHTPYVVNINENTPPGSIVFDGIKAFDRDKPNTPNSEVHFSMSTVPEQLSSDGSPYFALKSPHRPLLLLRKELDFDGGIRLFRLPIFAWDRGTPAHQTTTTITINVIDVDDLPPRFTEGVYRTKINEFYPMTGLPIRTPLYFSPPIMAYDQDSLNASLVYELISGNERQIFRVNSNNGVIYMQKEVDLEEESLPGNTFVLQLEARQKDDPLKKAIARIEIEVLDLNDNVPEFEADFYNISIVENLPTGFSVLQVNAIDRDQGENAEFFYNLVEKPEVSGAFRIDSRSGWITVRNDRLLDREQRKSLQLTVEAMERNLPHMIDRYLEPPKPSFVRVEITLLDTNDNTPKFIKGNLYEFKVPISATFGYEIGHVVAVDPDEGPNGMLVYELQRPKGSGYIPFRLNTKNGTICVNGPLRRGRIAVFVEASDQPLNPSERRFSLAVITIEVYATIDEQNIDFVGAPYEFWVGSNVPLGTSVGQVRTNLINDGEEEIMYDLLHTYSEGVPFAIEERSGIITVIRELKEFMRKLYNFEAVANYLFANSSQSQIMVRNTPNTGINSELTNEGVLITNVTIHVVNKTDHREPLKPVIEEINMNIIKFHIEENLIGGVIGQLLYKNGINVVNNDLASFRDLKEIGNATLGSRYRSQSHRARSAKTRTRIPRKLVNDMGIKLRYIIANQQEVVNKISITDDGTLMTLSGLDREEKPQYDLTVIVEYSTGLMSGAGIYQINIKVDDVNDNAPKFNGNTYMGLINENSASGTEVAIERPIQITDADEGRNAEFRAVLQGEYSEDFYIEFVNSTTNGQNQSFVISSIAETFSILNLTQQWADDFKLSDTQTQFLQSNRKLNSVPYFRVSYVGKRTLDREKEQIYNLKIIAVDSGGLSAYANLNILIADMNDNAPIFERISVFKESKVEIREYTTDMEIYFVESSLSAQMQPVPTSMVIPPYHIPGSPRLNMEMPQPNIRGRMRLGSRSRQSRAVPSVKHKPPMLKCPLFAIHEDIPLSTKILQVTANDEDFGKNAQVHYEITAEHIDRPISQTNTRPHGAKLFVIDKLSGELTLNYPLLANIEVFLNLSATDIDGLKDTTCLRFTVIDVNNHAPTFKKSWYSFDATEGQYKDSVLGQVVAVDLDYGQNANVTYTLSVLDLPFSIKPISGVIKIMADLDREACAKYNFQVIATDNADLMQRMSSSVDVEVNILDVNDNRPEFIGYDDVGKARHYISDLSDKTQIIPIYKAYLDRSTPTGTFVKQITAIDKDYMGNGNGLVLYSISHNSKHSPVFQIDSRDGIISTIGSFNHYNDYEHLNLTVIASDLGSPTLSSTAVVLINLQGQAVNANPPSTNISIFQHSYYEVEVLENNETPLELLKINLTSEFPYDHFRWTISIEEELDPVIKMNSLFEFDPKTIKLYALRSFDREQISRYSLRLRADKVNRAGRKYAKIAYPITDERISSLEHNECRVIVRILDVNDNTPKFKTNGQPIVAVVPRSATFGYPVTEVAATDDDEGDNAEIRYRLLNDPVRLFGINELNGKIRLINSVPMDERVYGFDVKATDRCGSDDGRSGIANVFVYVIDESKEVRIVLAGKPVEVEQKVDTLMTALSNAIQMDVRVRLLEPHIGGLEPATDAYIYAVDFRTNAVMEMEQLQESLSSLQFDALQLQQQYDQNIEQEQQQQEPNPNETSRKSMPRIIELSEFGQATRNSQSKTTSIGSLQIISIVLVSLCGIGACLATVAFMCYRQKRYFWSSSRQQEFPSSETGLTYGTNSAGIGSCRQNVNRQSTQQLQCGKSSKTFSSFFPESVCSSSQTQSTLAVSQKLEKQAKFHHSHHRHKNHVHRQREYIDVPLPKSVSKTNNPTNDGNNSLPFVLKYNSCQPVNNLKRNNPYETSMFSLNSNTQDSGVEFLSSRELYETSTDSFHLAQKYGKPRSYSADVLCPRHAKEHFQIKRSNSGNVIGTDSSDNYEDSLKNKELLAAGNYRNQTGLTRCNHHRHDYQNIEKRSCVRHSFSGVKDDLLQNSPQISLRPRGHTLRNSMNDLEERLHNLEQSFRSPLDLGKSSALF